MGLFGLLAGFGVARYPWLVGGGWLLHVLWDALVHPLGVASYAPEGYRFVCLGFDVLVGVKILLDSRE